MAKYDITAGAAVAGVMGENGSIREFNWIGWKAWFVAAAHNGVGGVAEMDCATADTSLEPVPPAFLVVDRFDGLGFRGRLVRLRFVHTSVITHVLTFVKDYFLPLQTIGEK